jgi:hypothetical protein
MSALHVFDQNLMHIGAGVDRNVFGFHASAVFFNLVNEGGDLLDVLYPQTAGVDGHGGKFPLQIMKI